MSSQSSSNTTTKSVELYPHESQAILPLLAAFLPHSLAVFASIQCGPIESPPTASDPLATPWRYVWATVSPDDVQSRITHPGQAEEGPDSVVIVQLAGSMKHQTRMFCSAERPRPNESAEEQLDRRKEAARLVTGAALRHLQIAETVTVLGAVHEFWVRELYDALRLEVRERLTDLWLEAGAAAPATGATQAQGDEEQEYVTGPATAEDCELVKEHRDIKEDIQYYLERQNHTTVVRHRPAMGKADDQTVAWIMTHAAGDQGALHVDPEHRRRGLARKVVLANLQRERDAGRNVRGHVWVMRGNEASEALWKAMGWERGWTVQWIHLDPRKH